MKKLIYPIFLPILFVLSACEEQSKDLNIEILKLKKINYVFLLINLRTMGRIIFLCI